MENDDKISGFRAKYQPFYAKPCGFDQNMTDFVEHIGTIL